MSPFKPELALARKAALAAGRFLREVEPRELASSCGRDIKLNEDKVSEEIILKILSESGLPVISEETLADSSSRPPGLGWIIDPIDGSYNYYKGLKDLCCVSVALWDGDRPVLGMVYKFGAGELYEGRPQEGAFLNDRRLSCSAVSKVEEASCATGFSVKGDFSDASLAENIKYFKSFKKIRMLGTAALSSAYVGVGAVDFYFEKDILIWDIAAGAAIVAAGGGLVDYKGKDGHKCDIRCFANRGLKEDYDRLFQ
jgi:myo-inositol-1(or 4)-monophosphatase